MRNQHLLEGKSMLIGNALTGSEADTIWLDTDGNKRMKKGHVTFVSVGMGTGQWFSCGKERIRQEKALTP